MRNGPAAALALSLSLVFTGLIPGASSAESIESLRARGFSLASIPDADIPSIPEPFAPLPLEDLGAPPLFRPLVSEWVSGRVIKVYDGDTLTLMIDGKKQKVRLAEIDAPEMEQPYGPEAGEFARALLLGKDIQVEVRYYDYYRRIIGFVWVDDVNVNEELVRRGYAWWYQYYSESETLAALQREARAGRRALWADADPEPPWDYRRRQRESRDYSPSGVVVRAATPSAVAAR